MQKTLSVLKENNLARILKTENSVAISYAQFDPDTGEQIEDKVIPLDVEALKTERENLQTRMDEIDATLSEVENAPIAEPVQAETTKLESVKLQADTLTPQ